MLIVILFYPSLLIQIQQPSFRRLLMDVTSFDSDRAICFAKAKNAILPMSVYTSELQISKSPVLVHVVKWGKDIDYSSSNIEFGYSAELCHNTPIIDTKRGSSAILSLQINKMGRNVVIGEIEVLIISNARKKSSDPDNYDKILNNFVSDISMDTADNQTVLHLDDKSGVQIMGVNNEPKRNVSFPRFISTDNGDSWKFISTQY